MRTLNGPVDAIVQDSALKGEELNFWMNVNTDMSLKWPNITQKLDPIRSRRIPR